ncbi:MAG: flagellar M-ring protein FliF [Firmicutes bacterium]|nr:flagellar M-ring protein FliF [Bacillota bacterium]
MAEASHSPGIWQQWREKIGQMSLQRKISVLLLIVAVLLILIFVGQALLRPKFAPLFADLEPEDAGRISKKLQDMGVTYKLGQEGRSILVPEDRVYELRIQLASEGVLLGSSAGFELFDQTKLGVTDFSQRMDYQRALQEELRRTIVQLEEVEQARVHLALPEPSLFIRESVSPSASIVLKLKPYASLDQAQIRGIMQLVAGSVENLKVEDVTIVDTKGNLLSDISLIDPAGQAADATSRQFAVRREFEAELERRLQRLLDRVLGPGQSIAMVTAELDFDSQETTMITFGTEGVPRSQTITKETWESTGGALQPGEAGTDSNIPGYIVESSQGEVDYERTDETTNYELNEITEKQIMAPGRLQRLHTAVVLNTKAGQLKREQIEQIERTVAAAIGYQEERGDSISVSGMDFDTSLAEEAEREFAAAEQRERIREYITMGVYALAALLVLIFGLRLLAGRRKRTAEGEPAEVPQVPAPAEEEELVAIEAASEESQLRKRVRQLAEKEPETAAFLIRAWLSEE